MAVPLGLVGCVAGGFITRRTAVAMFYAAGCGGESRRAAFELLTDYVIPGTRGYAGSNVLLESRHIYDLKSHARLTLGISDLIWLLQRAGDEVLDYRRAVILRLPAVGAVTGGNHAFTELRRLFQPDCRFSWTAQLLTVI